MDRKHEMKEGIFARRAEGPLIEADNGTLQLTTASAVTSDHQSDDINEAGYQVHLRPQPRSR